MKQFKLDDLLFDITTEHYELAKVTDQSISYLWFMYNKGTKAGDYRPFIFMAEMQLLKQMGYLTDDEINNLLSMMDSKDTENFHLLCLALNSLRKLRIKDHGEYKGELNESYKELINTYSTSILNHEIFMKTYKSNV